MNVGKIINTIQELNHHYKNGGLIWGMKIIYDSNFGYEFGYYIQPSKIVSFAEHINLVTGIVQEDFYTTCNIIPYTKENYEKMITKYNYKQTLDF